MKIQLSILNTEKRVQTEAEAFVSTTTWYSRNKSYESDWLDDDMIYSPSGKILDRAIIENAELRTVAECQALINFIYNVKEALTHDQRGTQGENKISF